MSMFIYRCECGCSVRKVGVIDNLVCDSCGCLMKKDVLGSLKKQSNDRVPGGYDEETLNEWIRSEEGVSQESAYLSGENNYAY